MLFCKIDDYLYIVEDLFLRFYFVNVMVVGFGNVLCVIYVKYIVMLYFVYCVYWDRKRNEWSDIGCKVRKK